MDQEDKIMKKIVNIEEHVYETPNHGIRTEYLVFRDEFVYTTKTKSQLTKTEKEWLKNNGIGMIFHF